MKHWTEDLFKVEVPRHRIPDALEWLLENMGYQGKGWHRTGHLEFSFELPVDAALFIDGVGL